MVKVRKFKGYIPPKDKVDKVISPPYDVLDTKEARAMAGDNPMSFLRCNKPEIEFPDSTDPYSQQIYERARDNLQKFVKEGYLVKDTEDRMYVYAQKMGNHRQFAICALSSIEDYEASKIKKHELTRKDKEADRTKITDIQNANMGPVFLGYKHKETIDEVIKKVVSGEPYSDVVTADGIQHTLWFIDPKTSDFLVQEFATIPETYICDGHHRAASAYNVGKMRRDKAIAEGKKVTGEEEFNFFLTLLYPDNNLKILDYNRVLKFLNNKTESQILYELMQKYIITPVNDEPIPKKKGQHCLFIGGKWFRLDLDPKYMNFQDPIASLDVEILKREVIEPIFGISDLRTDKRIDFVGGIRGFKELEKRCSEDCKCAFAMYPVTIGEVMKIADSGLIMPPKSTWFEPKPRSGFVVRIFESN